MKCSILVNGAVCAEEPVYVSVITKKRYCKTHKIDGADKLITRKKNYTMSRRKKFDPIPNKRREFKRAPSCYKCDRRPTYGNKDAGIMNSCVMHATSDMERLNRRFCIIDKCSEIAKLGGNTQCPIFCPKHAKEILEETPEAHIVKASTLCYIDDCYISGSFRDNIDGHMYCLKHRPKLSINTKKKLCAHVGCDKGATYGYRSDTHCYLHRSKDMLARHQKDTETDE